jgi:protein phosphatase
MSCIGSTCHGLWCGDSRAYLVRDGETTQLSHDHSWAWEVVDSGLMTQEAAGEIAERT